MKQKKPYCLYLCIAIGLCAPTVRAQPADPELDITLKLEARRAQGQDSQDELMRDTSRFDAELVLELEQQLGAGAKAFAELQLLSRWYSRSPEFDGEDDQSYKLEQLYFQYSDAEKDRRWRLGRQTLDDDMRWFVDAELDGLRFTQRAKARQFDLSLTRQDWFKASTEKREDRIYNLLARFEFDAGKRASWVPYILHRSEKVFDDSPSAETTWLGLQGLRRPGKRFGYWLNTAVRTGKQKDNGDTRQLGGYAVDTGITWTLDRRFDPALTFGLAHASGDSSDSNDDNDEFRQTDLHSNNFRLNGLNRFRYLGEVVDPELTNIEIATLGAGMQINKQWSADIAYHWYRQVVSEDRLRGSDIEYEPSGLDDDLGDAFDIIVGFERDKALSLQAVAGVFYPGDAFVDAPDRAWVARVEIDYEF